MISGAAAANFWDVALCMEEDMQDLTQDCQVGLNHSNPWLGMVALSGACQSLTPMARHSGSVRSLSITHTHG